MEGVSEWVVGWRDGCHSEGKKGEEEEAIQQQHNFSLLLFC